MTKPSRDVGYHFNQVIAIQSLDANECKTSRILLEYMETQCADHELAVEFRSFNCQSAQEFRATLKEVLFEAQNLRKMPLLHIETHGDEATGLIFENGSELSWADLTTELRVINVACGFNLFVVCTACYGFHCIGPIDILEAAPFYAVLAPSHSLDPGEILGALMQFYRIALVERDIGAAYGSLRSVHLRDGYWFCMSAEHWYERLLLGFAHNHCTDKGLDAQVRLHFRKLQAMGAHNSKGHIKRKLISRIQTVLQSEAFERFFATAILPSNRNRFAAVFTRVFAKLKPPLISPKIKLRP